MKHASFLSTNPGLEKSVAWSKYLHGACIECPRSFRQVEWPTIVLSLCIYASWLLLTFFHKFVPVPTLLVIGASIIAIHSSLQHETMHGHPTRSRRLNKLIGYPPLSLWLPYEIYKYSHLQHHINENLTDPFDDPESKYMSEEVWQRLSKFERRVVSVNATVFGRLTIGPLLTISRFWHAELLLAMDGYRSHLPIWSKHLAAVSVVVAWLLFCKFDLLQYLMVVYSGTSLLALRSYAEHKANPKVSQRTAIVENASIFGLLYLNNNLHAVHHRFPGLSWYDLPTVYRQNRTEFLVNNGYLIYDSYAQIITRFMFKAADLVVHPSALSRRHHHAQAPKMLLSFSRTARSASVK